MVIISSSISIILFKYINILNKYTVFLNNIMMMMMNNNNNNILLMYYIFFCSHYEYKCSSIIF